MPKSETPTAERVREIAFHLCRYLEYPAPAPSDLTSAFLNDASRRILRSRRKGARAVVFALRLCASELAWFEAAPEIRALATALRNCETWLSTGLDVRKELGTAIRAAEPALAREARRQEGARERVRRRNAGAWRSWPSPESLKHAPSQLARHLAETEKRVSELQKIIEDLFADAPHPKVRLKKSAFVPFVAQILKSAALTTSQICDILEPWKRGKARQAARNRIVKYMRAKPPVLSARIQLGQLATAEVEEIRRTLEATGYVLVTSDDEPHPNG